MSSSAAPAAVKILVLLVSLEVLFLVASTITGVLTADDTWNASVVGSFFLIVAISLAVGARALWKQQRFSRALILIWQLFAVIIGVQLALGGALLYGLATVLVAGAVILLMFTQKVLSHTHVE